MRYVDGNGQEFELPKMTMEVARAMNAVRGASDPEDAWRRELAFVCSVLPGEYVAERLDGSQLDDVDLSELDVLYTEVVRAYTAPSMKAQAGAARDAMGVLDGANLDKLMAIVEAAQRLESAKRPRKGFRAVR